MIKRKSADPIRAALTAMCDAMERDGDPAYAHLIVYARAALSTPQEAEQQEARASAWPDAALLDALESIRQYGSDTLSGRVDGPDDRGWQREAVQEMTRRARSALNARGARSAAPAPTDANECRIELATAVHGLISQIENTLHVFRDDEEARRQAVGAAEHARKVAARWNWNGAWDAATRLQAAAPAPTGESSTQAEPLSDEWIDEILTKAVTQRDHGLARAIEADHGITPPAAKPVQPKGDPQCF